MGYAGADWIAGKVPTISPFGRHVADLLGDVFLGIYHIDSPSLRKADWASDHWISVAVYGPMSTFDNSMLTRLVFLAHERCVRLEIKGAAPNYLRLNFAARSRESRDIYGWHPTVLESIELLATRDVAATAGRMLSNASAQTCTPDERTAAVSRDATAGP